MTEPERKRQKRGDPTASQDEEAVAPECFAMIDALVISHIMAFLPREDIARLARTCKRCYAVMQSPTLWRTLCKRDFDVAFRRIEIPWLEVYKDEVWFVQHESQHRHSVGKPVPRKMVVGPSPIIESVRHAMIIDASLRTTRCLMQSGWNPRINDNEALFYAVAAGAYDTAKLMLQHSNVGFRHLSAHVLRTAAGNGDVQMVRLLLDDNREQQNDHIVRDALRMAAQNGYFAATRVLLEHRLRSANKTDSVALAAACRGNRVELVKMLLEHPRVDLGFVGSEVLRDVCENGYWKIVWMLLEHERIELSAKLDTLGYVLQSKNSTALEHIVENSMLDIAPYAHAIYGIAISYRKLGLLQLLVNDERLKMVPFPGNIVSDTLKKRFVDALDVILADPRVHPIRIPRELFYKLQETRCGRCMYEKIYKAEQLWVSRGRPLWRDPEA